MPMPMRSRPLARSLALAAALAPLGLAPTTACAENKPAVAAVPPKKVVPAPAPPVQWQKPNLYTLSGATLHVTFSTSGVDGKPHLTYQDAGDTKAFAGDEIHVVDTEIGQIVTVSIRKTIDSGSTTFSLLIPRANVPAGTGHSLPIQVVGITTVHRYSIIPALNQGPTEVYSTVALSGTAQAVAF